MTEKTAASNVKLINFDIDIFTLDTKDKAGIKMPGSIPEFIGKLLLHSTFRQGDVQKRYSLATRIAKEGKVSLDKPDLDIVIAAIYNDASAIEPIVQAQLLKNFTSINWGD